MGCGSSKVDDLPLVTLCRERRDFIKTAADHRYALAAAHVSYFQSLKDIGDALRKFVDEEIVVAGADSSSFPGSPVLTLPSEEGKRRKPKTKLGNDDEHKSRNSSSSASISQLNSPGDEEIEDSHLHLASGSDSDSESGSSAGHIRMEESVSPKEETEMQSPPQNYYPGGWASPIPPGVNSFMHFAKRSETPMQSMVYEEPETERYHSSSGYGNSGYSFPQSSTGGFYGFSMGSPPAQNDYYPYPYRQQNSPPPPPAPPSPPKVSTWDYLNIFDTYDNSGYPVNYSRYGFGSNASSPDSTEVREREGIPELEDETETEGLKRKVKAKKKASDQDGVNGDKNSVEGTSSRAVPAKQHGGEGSSRPVPSKSNDSPESTEMKSSSGTIDSIGTTTASKSPGEESTRKKGVSFEIDETQNLEVESSKPSSLTTLSVHGTRDLQEVVKEIRDEFETASGYGKEVAMLLEVGKLPYQPRATAFGAIFARILYLIAPSMLSSHPPSGPPIRLSSRTIKLAKAYDEELGKDPKLRSGNLSSTLEKLYAWEKKLHKEVKDEERLRVIYEKTCKKLRYLDEHGAESSKIDATQASIRKLLTKIDVCIKAVDGISARINRLRDEELLPQVTEFIHGLINMWKSMFKCHQKQFQAIMESKMRSLKMNTSRRDTGLKATLELEMELMNWCTCFNNWITTQKSYVESLNEWLSRCLHQEPEVTADGIAPFSPGRIGAPTIFIICHDWFQAMERISEKRVSSAMSDFAATLHQLWERQDEAQRQRIKAEFLSKDFDKRLRQLRMERGKLEQERSSDKAALSRVPSGGGVSPLDDLKVDLDSMRKKLTEERARHKEAMKLVHDAASNSLQAGLTPIFEALGSFTSEVLKAHQQVRLQNAGVE